MKLTMGMNINLNSKRKPNPNLSLRSGMLVMDAYKRTSTMEIDPDNITVNPNRTVGFSQTLNLIFEAVSVAAAHNDLDADHEN